MALSNFKNIRITTLYINSIIRNNSSDQSGSAIYIEDNVTLDSVAVYGNYNNSQQYSTISLTSNKTLNVTNSTITGNGSYGISSSGNNYINITNSIFFNNLSDDNEFQIIGTSIELNINYSLIENPQP